MTQLLLYTAQESSQIANIVAWVTLSIIVILLVGLIFWQQKQGKELTSELQELDKLQKHNVEYEFVLKTMRLSTWHINAKTREIIFDTVFRDKAETYIPSMGKELVGAMPEDDRLRVTKSLNDLCEGRTDYAHEEYQIRVANGKKTYWSESYAAVAERDADGLPTRIVGTSARIDERKAMESALIDARNRAEESDRLKTAFLANMSHEIRTPLNAIIGFTSVLPDVQDADERQQLLDLIHENTQKLLRIIDDVVNISKIEAGKEEMMLTQFDLVQVLTPLADEYRQKCHPGVTLQTQYASEMQLITTDLSRFIEVVKHLLSNATKFTDQGTVTIGFDAPHEGRISIWVSDTGKGIA